MWAHGIVSGPCWLVHIVKYENLTNRFVAITATVQVNVIMQHT